METNEKPLMTFEDVTGRLINQVAGKVSAMYSRYLVTYDDVKSELMVWIYTPKNAERVEGWLANEPQQTTRVRYALQDAAKAYAEKMKAEKLGYDESDIHWYSVSQVAALLPLALDPTYDGTGPLDIDRTSSQTGMPKAKKDPGTTGDLMTMVMDVRLALSNLNAWVEFALVTEPPGSSVYDSAIEAVVAYLGGPRTGLGTRRVMTNAEAHAKMRSYVDE